MADHSLTIQGVRSRDNFMTVEPAVMVVTPLMDWHIKDGNFAGLEFSIETTVWRYSFAISRGGLQTLMDMQDVAQRDTDEQITRERGHKP